MKLVVGLGNPGTSYVATRHNTGCLFVDEFQKSLPLKNVLAQKTNTFMNDSGCFVKAQTDKYQVKPEDLYIIHDDLDIPLGEFKIQFGKGPKDHNGLRSINQALGTDQYWHIRIGIDNRPFDNKPMGEEYVLQDFTDKERNIVNGVIKNACKKLEILLTNTN